MIEVEVERLPEREGPPGTSRSGTGARFRSALAPVLAGLVLDLVDLATFHPVAGLLLGALCGSQLLRHLDLRPSSRALAILACGVYCALPVTTFLPLATLLGAASRYLTAPPGR